MAKAKCISQHRPDRISVLLLAIFQDQMKGLHNSLQKLDTLENKCKPQHNPSKDMIVTLI